MDPLPSCNIDNLADELLRCGLESDPCQDNDNNGIICAICMGVIPWEDYCQIKGCEHSYCTLCILNWIHHKGDSWCPQCRSPFSMLYLYRNLDGSLSDYLIEESVCLLLCTTWFISTTRGRKFEAEEANDPDYFEDEAEEIEMSRTLRLGNRRWGESGYIRGGHMQAKPVSKKAIGKADKGAPKISNESSSNSQVGNSEGKKMGRRARRAQQRRLADGEGSGTQ